MTIKGPTLVEKIEHLGDGVLRITFDGNSKDIDISETSLAKRYPRLKDPDYVQKAYFEEGCIKWPEGGPWLDADELEFIPETSKFKNRINVASSTKKRKQILNALRKVVR